MMIVRARRRVESPSAASGSGYGPTTGAGVRMLRRRHVQLDFAVGQHVLQSGCPSDQCVPDDVGKGATFRGRVAGRSGRKELLRRERREPVQVLDQCGPSLG